jgi:hypothetical protein
MEWHTDFVPAFRAGLPKDYLNRTVDHKEHLDCLATLRKPKGEDTTMANTRRNSENAVRVRRCTVSVVGKDGERHSKTDD